MSNYGSGLTVINGVEFYRYVAHDRRTHRKLDLHWVDKKMVTREEFINKMRETINDAHLPMLLQSIAAIDCLRRREEFEVNRKYFK